ncbi:MULTISPECIES: hypothetical protein [unclassified Streptomyces]|uniref:hypothetical protein n=1 Tax=unclassified Streptomyces TaxID=2593676 RepID=UPI0004BE89F0|nr:MULTISPECIES: hypothetical protein [unclassified Streptomyces]
MHRTTTTATLLVTVAVSALSGCMTVQRSSAPGPPVAPPRPSAPHPAGQAETQAVPAPAREALARIETSRRPEPAASESRPPAPAAAPPKRAVPSGRRDQHPHPVRPEPRPRGTHRPHVDAPDVAGRVRQDVQKRVPDHTDVCALGRRYGGWPADSPQATICRDTYGR